MPSRRHTGLSPRDTEVLPGWLRHDSGSAAPADSPVIARIRERYAACGRPATTRAAPIARALQDGLLELHDP